MTKVIDGQNISLADAICNCGFKRLDDQQFELTDGNKKFVLSNLVGVVREIPVLEDNDENVQAGNSANGKQEIKHKKQVQNKEGGNDNIQLAGDPLQDDQDFESKENTKQTKALEQNGFHVIGENGYQSGSGGGGKNNNVNKDSITGPSIIKANSGGNLSIEGKDREADGSHLENEKDRQNRKSRKS